MLIESGSESQTGGMGRWKEGERSASLTNLGEVVGHAVIFVVV